MTVTFTRKETGDREYIAARGCTAKEARDLIAALLRLPHITSAYVR